jgi:hypothetical protein
MPSSKLEEQKATLSDFSAYMTLFFAAGITNISYPHAEKQLGHNLKSWMLRKKEEREIESGMHA